MQRRGIFAVVVTILFIAGMCSSAACDMMCQPQIQSGVCCPAQMQHMSEHMMASCEHAQGPMLTDQHNCHHSQGSSGQASLNASSSIHIISSGSVTQLVPSSSSQASSVYDRVHSSLLNRPANLPLRI
jgi:hypothetical protein